MTVDSNSALIEDYVDEYLKKYYGELAWVQFAYSLESSPNEYAMGRKKCQTVQNYVIRKLNQTHKMNDVDAYIKTAIEAVEVQKPAATSKKRTSRVATAS